VYYIYIIRMSKKQTIRTLGSKQNIKPIEIFEDDTDDDIQKSTEKVLKPKKLKQNKQFLEEEVITPPIETPIISKKKRNLTEEQKEVLRERLAHARSL
jgi:hypothetical protein